VAISCQEKIYRKKKILGTQKLTKKRNEQVVKRKEIKKLIFIACNENKQTIIHPHPQGGREPGRGALSSR
jgi:hypothetical protein